MLPGIYHGAVGTVVRICFVSGTVFGKYRRISCSGDGSLAVQVARGRPLPAVVYVQMDDKKLDTALFPDAIVPFTPQQRHITSTHGGKNIISR